MSEIRAVRSVRRFVHRPIAGALLRQVLDAGRCCGSSKNGQPWQFVVVTEPATLRSLSVLGPYAGFLADAPAAVVPVMDSGGEVWRAFDCGRVSQAMMLAAASLGLGSCVAAIGPAENQRIAAATLGVPRDRDVWIAIALGYPRRAEGERALNRKRLEKLVHVEVFGRRDAALGQSALSASGLGRGATR